MSDKIVTLVQEAFGECYNLDDVARLYFDIRMECEKQLSFMNLSIAKEMKENGVLDEKGGAE